MTKRRWIDALRVATLVAMCAAAAASASSSNKTADQPPPYGAAPQGQPMEPTRALGLWKSSFGAVKIFDNPGNGGVDGIWLYQKNGQDVKGYFSGALSGNVLQFTWREPADPAPNDPSVLAGEGYVVFDPQGQRFNGRWWTTSRDRTGEWSGWRQNMEPNQPSPPNTGGQYDPYGGSTNPYGGGYNGGNNGGYGGDPYGGSTYGYGYPPPPPSNGPY